MRRLDGRVAVVTGGASGIGLALARRLAQEGMAVVLGDVEVAALEAAVAALRGEGADVLGVPCDVADAAQVLALRDAALEAHGAVHVLCANAGVDAGAPFEALSLEAWDWVLGVDLEGVVGCVEAFLPVLRGQDEAHVVTTGSLASLDASLPTVAPYVTAKFAVLGLSEVLAHELRGEGSHVGVSALLPGVVRTGMPTSERNRPAHVPDTSADPRRAATQAFLTRALEAGGMDPAEVAGMVVEAIREERFHVLCHPDLALQAVDARLAWMRGDEAVGTTPGPEAPPL